MYVFMENKAVSKWPQTLHLDDAGQNNIKVMCMNKHNHLMFMIHMFSVA